MKYPNDYENDLEREYTTPFYTKPPRNNNNVLIVVTAILCTIAVIMVVVAALIVSGVVSFGGSDSADKAANSPEIFGQHQTVDPTETPDRKSGEMAVSAPPAPAKQPVPVEKTMYIGNCNVSVTLRTGPGTDYSEIRQIAYGEEVYVIEYTTDDFAKVMYNGSRGYVMRDYVVGTKPTVYYYNDEDVKAVVANSIRAFVQGITNKNPDYVYEYFAGDLVQEELNSYNSIAAVVEREDIVSLNCHSVERVAPNRVTCIRDSVIRVTYNDGSIKDITEKYKYTVDITGNLYIVDLQEM